MAERLPTPIDPSRIAPCGMNCALCRGYLRTKNHCDGCRTAAPTKPKYCTACRIRNCTRLGSATQPFCFACDQFPCAPEKHLDKRYRMRYAVSLIANLREIEADGLAAFVEREAQRWQCPACGARLCVHRGQCLACGAKRPAHLAHLAQPVRQAAGAPLPPLPRTLAMPETLDLNMKTIPPDSIAERALEAKPLLEALLAGISPEAKKAPLRENSSQALMHMAETWPEALLPHWDYFIRLLKSDNGFSKYAAIYIVTALARVDEAGRFEKAFNTYFGRLDDESVMVASHAAKNASRLVKAYPALEPKITRRLLAVDQTHFDANRRDLVKAYILEAFDGYLGTAKEKAKILAFVKAQLACHSPKTRKLAKALLQKWEGEGQP